MGVKARSTKIVSLYTNTGKGKAHLHARVATLCFTSQFGRQHLHQDDRARPPKTKTKTHQLAVVGKKHDCPLGRCGLTRHTRSLRHHHHHSKTEQQQP